MKKRLRLRTGVKNVLAIILIWGILVLGVIALNDRLGQLNENVTQQTTTYEGR